MNEAKINIDGQWLMGPQETEAIFPHADGKGQTILRGIATVQRWEGDNDCRTNDSLYDRILTGDYFYERDGKYFHARTGRQIYLVEKKDAE